ncbi:regulatory protein RecX [Solimonas soli]|uniref:regulatory protein RecX n=1 Tax=Solimonas soli TaxID=413479 RepID=UPI0004869D69|nr:regulatory protein RecX [Solimonas soli]
MRKRPPPSKRSGREAGAGDRAAAEPSLDPDAARARALKLLSRREHSAAELARKLQRRGAEPDTARDTVARMQEAGWQSDARYAEMLVRNRMAQGYGPLRIRAELAAARVPDAEARAALDAAEADWPALCTELRARKFRAPPRTPAEWQKQYRYLASHGFSAEAARAALKAAGGDASSAPEAEDWECPEA